jgi:hypothetical protein
MEKNNYSAEKELLKTIEESSENGSKKKSKHFAANTGELKSRSLFFFDKLKNDFFSPKINDFKQKFISSDDGTLNFDTIQNILKLGVYLLLLSYLVTVGRSIYRLNHIPTFNVSAVKPGQISAKEASNTLKEFVHYSSILLERNIFTPPAEKEQPREATEISKARQLTDNLKVTGISWSENVKECFVMVEDIKKEVTYFLQEGDQILNLTVNEIARDKVILDYQGEEVVLQ